MSVGFFDKYRIVGSGSRGIGVVKNGASKRLSDVEIIYN